MQPPSFSTRLSQAIRSKGNAVMVGLDPRYDLLPAVFRTADGSRDFAGVAESYRRFCCAVIDVVAPLVPIVKPQAAFFEQIGADGMVALQHVIHYARQQGLLVVFDGKRNDIGSTAAAYADGILGDTTVSPWAADAVTVSPYLGEDSLLPFVETATQRAAGVFVLVKTSNQGSGMLQDILVDGQPLYRRVATWVENMAVKTVAENGYGDVGAVVGATWPKQLAELREAMPHTWLLVPGYGSQGGSAKDVACAFDKNGFGAVINNSRGILFSFRDPKYSEKYGDTLDEKHWEKAVETATKNMIAALDSSGCEDGRS